MNRFSRGCSKIILITLIFLAAFGDEKILFSPAADSIDKMRLDMVKSPFSQSNRAMLRFTFDQETIRLYLDPLLNRKALQILSLTSKATVVKLSQNPDGSPLRLSSKHSGSFAAVFPEFQTDINNDGTADQVHLSAKADTLFTQGFVAVRTNFSDTRMPLEIDSRGKQQIAVLFNQQPLPHQWIQISSPRGLSKKVATDAEGMVKIADMRDLSTGISVLYSPAKNDYYITNYIRDSYTLFSSRHWKAMSPLVMALGLAIPLTFLLLFIRSIVSFQNCYRKKLTMEKADSGSAPPSLEATK